MSTDTELYLYIALAYAVTAAVCLTIARVVEKKNRGEKYP